MTPKKNKKPGSVGKRNPGYREAIRYLDAAQGEIE